MEVPWFPSRYSEVEGDYLNRFIALHDAAIGLTVSTVTAADSVPPIEHELRRVKTAHVLIAEDTIGPATALIGIH